MKKEFLTSATLGVAVLTAFILTGCGEKKSDKASTNSTAASKSGPLPESPGLTGAKATGQSGDTEWQALERASRGPATPPEWRTNQPSPAQIAEFEKSTGKLAADTADQARDFYTKFSKHDRAADAKKLEMELLSVAVQLGQTNHLERMRQAETARLTDPSLSETDRFEMRARQVLRPLMDDANTNRSAMLGTVLEDTRKLQKEFPQRAETAQILMMVAQSFQEAGETPKAVAIYTEISTNASPEMAQMKEAAAGEMAKLDRVGKPLELQFTSTDNKEIDVQKMKGKVVLVDFWATWCGPCRVALPELKAVYEKFHDKGFEVLGISFDQSKEDLTKFVQEEKMPWPQYFDGEGWENKLGQKFGITAIPAVWLVDKKGVLRDLNGRQNLEAKVQKFLAE